MKLTNDLLEAVGFVRVDDMWLSKRCKLYTHQVPDTLKDLIAILTGNAFNKGRAYEKKLCEQAQELPGITLRDTRSLGEDY